MPNVRVEHDRERSSWHHPFAAQAEAPLGAIFKELEQLKEQQRRVPEAKPPAEEPRRQRRMTYDKIASDLDVLKRDVAAGSRVRFLFADTFAKGGGWREPSRSQRGCSILGRRRAGAGPRGAGGAPRAPRRRAPRHAARRPGAPGRLGGRVDGPRRAGVAPRQLLWRPQVGPGAIEPPGDRARRGPRRDRRASQAGSLDRAGQGWPLLFPSLSTRVG